MVRLSQDYATAIEDKVKVVIGGSDTPEEQSQALSGGRSQPPDATHRPGATFPILHTPTTPTVGDGSAGAAKPPGPAAPAHHHTPHNPVSERYVNGLRWIVFNCECGAVLLERRA